MYLPPGYEQEKQRYPEIYLVHGTGGNRRVGVRIYRFGLDRQRLGVLLRLLRRDGLAHLRPQTFFVTRGMA